MDAHADVLELNQMLLNCIARGDWSTYQELCDPTVTAFEPEAHGALVEGLQFHYFYFDLSPKSKLHAQTMMIAPKVRVMGDVAVVAYVRLNQREQPDGTPVSQAFAETRVWQKQGDTWKHVHFHRTSLSKE
jgi:calcium/calmodulin-dependent protein kinase (CaM kinase) II